MKLKIMITGHKVHDVGYRYHLLGLARSSKLKGFDAENQIADVKQHVEVLVEGGDAAIRKFGDIIQIFRTPGAEISDISLSSYKKWAMKLAEYSGWCTNIQLNMGIQAILDSNKIIERVDSCQEDTIKAVQENWAFFAFYSTMLILMAFIAFAIIFTAIGTDFDLDFAR